MRHFALRLSMRYTRVSCAPMRATMELDRIVLARDAEEAVRQACLCLDRDLEELLWAVNAMNVSEVHLAFLEVRELGEGEALPEQVWNQEPFPDGLAVPPHVVVSSTPSR